MQNLYEEFGERLADIFAALSAEFTKLAEIAVDIVSDYMEEINKAYFLHGKKYRVCYDAGCKRQIRACENNRKNAKNITRKNSRYVVR